MCAFKIGLIYGIKGAFTIIIYVLWSCIGNEKNKLTDRIELVGNNYCVY